MVTKLLRGGCPLVKGYCLPHTEFIIIIIIIIIIILSSLLERFIWHYRMIHAPNLRAVCSLWGNVSWFPLRELMYLNVCPLCEAWPCLGSHKTTLFTGRSLYLTHCQPFWICVFLFFTVSYDTLYFLFLPFIIFSSFSFAKCFALIEFRGIGSAAITL